MITQFFLRQNFVLILRESPPFDLILRDPHVKIIRICRVARWSCLGPSDLLLEGLVKERRDTSQPLHHSYIEVEGNVRLQNRN
jgi:hypothetical protein